MLVTRDFSSTIDPGNPRRCLRSIKWTKARDGFVHVQPEQDARIIDPGNPRRCLRSIKWTKARDGFVHVQMATWSALEVNDGRERRR
jgi:hypothetical protein